MKKFSIKPVTKTLDSLLIMSVRVNLDKSAQIVCELTNSIDVSVQYNLTMDTTAYSAWGENDEYVIQWVMTQLGVQPA
jgi:hypothetical protein